MKELVDAHPELLLLLFPVILVVLSFLFAHMGGWSALASEYRAWDPFEGKVWRAQRAGVGATNYGGSVHVGANDRGLHLSVISLLRLWHPPLFIPWDDVSATEKRFLWMRFVDLRFKRVPDARVRFAKGLADKIKHIAGAHWPADPNGGSSSEPSVRRR